MRWKFRNVPVPEAHVLGLVSGVILHMCFSKRLFPSSRIGRLMGWPLIAAGVGLCGWAVREAEEMQIESPDRLLQEGPYAVSRNPMYVGWTMIYLGISFALNSAWNILIFPFVVIYTHLVEIRREERDLEAQFGEEYRRYHKEVRRYI